MFVSREKLVKKMLTLGRTVQVSATYTIEQTEVK